MPVSEIRDGQNSTYYNRRNRIGDDRNGIENSNSPPIDISDIMSLGSDELRNIIRMSREKYVEEHHKRKISYVESRGIWRTYVGNPRKEITRKEKDDIIDYLYDYYKEEESRNCTFREAFESFQKYRKDEINRSLNTIKTDEYVYKRFVPDEFGQKKIGGITDSDINRMIKDKVEELKPKAKALKGFITLVRQVFRYALHHKIISNDPCKYISIQNYLKDCDMTRKNGDEKIFTAPEIRKLKHSVKERVAKKVYDPHGCAILLSIETGMRIAELPPLRWEDITERGLHIHRQQLYIRSTNEYTEVPYTKNERRNPKGGRYFPITDEIRWILNACKEGQEKVGIESEFIFARKDGGWVKKRFIAKSLKNECEKLGYGIVNNHALRMSLNSNVLIPLGITVTQRAYLLGHSIETNQKHYSYMHSNELSEIKEKLQENTPYTQPYTQKIVNFDDFTYSERMATY